MGVRVVDDLRVMIFMCILIPLSYELGVDKQSDRVGFEPKTPIRSNPRVTYSGQFRPYLILDFSGSGSFRFRLEEVPSKIKGLVRNVKRVEAEIAALKTSYLQKINKGSNIVILDSYSDSAKIVARTLTRLGFKNSWIVGDGFSGGKGWLQSRLGTNTYKFSFAEVLSPSRIIPAGVKSAGTTSRQSNQKLLPGAD
ncbi:calcium sensing receptor, chloroplastic-like [Vicia villosa]|uniref:calcium sensing receptor, chloroplastic-like n=1 Tax=Vicia villosa TaxID=3911 RepID=UPI00273B21E6|nr:calcium sensing receptor, chloroplastic-like [Vicia villosa]